MKITGYQQSVGTGGVASNTIKTVGNALAYGAGGTGAAALSKAYGQVAAAIEQRNEQEDKESILNAMDVFNKSRYNIMYNDESGLMNTKLEGSAGITESYNDQINKARQDILGNTKLHSKKNQVALNHLMYNSAQEGFQTVDRYQQKQHEAVTDLRYDNNIQNYSEFVQKNWDDEQLLDNAIEGAKLTTSMVYGKRGAEFLEAQTRKSVGNIVAGAVDAGITHGDYDKTRKMLDKYGHLLNANQRATFERSLYQKEEGAFENDLAKRLVAQYGDDEAAIKAALAKENAYSRGGNVEQQAEGTTWVRNNDTVSLNGVKQQVTTGLSDIAKEFNAMSGAQLIVTSGTDSTDIHQAGAHSHGAGVKLDVAADWLENADNRQKFITYAESKGIKVLDEYAHPSANSTGGHLDLDFTDYKGGDRQQTRLLNHEEQDKIWQACSREINANKRIKQYNETKLYNEIKNDIFSMLQNGTSYTDAFAWAERQAGSDPDKYVSYVNAVKSIYGAGGNAGSGTGSGSSSGKMGKIGKDALLDMLGAGAFSDKDKAYFLAYAREHGATNSEMDALDKGWDDWLSGAGQFAYNWSNLATSVMGKKNDQNMKNGLIKAGKEFVRTYRAQHNGMNPDESLIIEQMNKDIVNKVYGTYQVHRDWLPDLSVTVQGNNAQLAAAGIASVEKVGDDWYHVTYFDGTDGNINGGYLAELIGGGR